MDIANFSHIDIGNLIRRQLRKQGRSQKWLADQLFITKSCLSKKLKQDRISVNTLLRISVLLQYDFFAELQETYLENCKNV